MNEAEVYGKIIKVQKARKMNGPKDKAIWDDKEYVKKYGRGDEQDGGEVVGGENEGEMEEETGDGDDEN